VSSRYNVEPFSFDVALYHRQGLWPWKASTWISAAQWSPWTHAGIIVRGVVAGVERVFVCDAAPPTVDVRPLSADVRRGYRIALLRVPEAVPRPYLAGTALAGFVFRHWGLTGYSIPKLVEQLYYLVAGPGGAADAPEPPARYICSELVSWVLRVLYDYDPCPDRKDRVTKPADLARSGRLVWLTDRLALQEA